MNRRELLTGALAASAALAVPSRTFARPAPSLRDQRLLDIAAREVERNAATLWHRDVVGICDFGLHSSQPRFHFVDLVSGQVDSALVSHGSGSDPEHDGWLNDYSNLHDSWATSRGAYITWEWYEGRYGTSVRMGGLDATNSNAFDRAIVMHQADYATPSHVERWGRLGRSNGCPAFGPETFPDVLYRLRGGRLIFADTLGIGAEGQDVVMPPQATVDFEAAIAARRYASQPEAETSESELERIYREANPGLPIGQ